MRARLFEIAGPAEDPCLNQFLERAGLDFDIDRIQSGACANDYHYKYYVIVFYRPFEKAPVV